MIAERLKKLEKVLREKLSNNWDSVRKAFLGLDTDYDGYITVEDILRNFGNSSGPAFNGGAGANFNFNDLQKILIEKDSTGQGRIGYADFSKWVGNSIH
jgi:Ca2+-binding EF-hand superfamily protein